MRATIRHLLQSTILTAAEIAERTGLSEAAVLQRAYRGTAAFMRKGKGHRGTVLLFDAHDFATEIRRHKRAQQRTKQPENVDKS